MSLILVAALAQADPALYAREDLRFGAPIEAGQVVAIELEPQWVGVGLVGEPADIVGRIPRFDLPADTRLREEHLFPAGTPPGPEGLAPPGTVAVEIPLPEPTGLVQAGDLVDVYAQVSGRFCLAADQALVLGVRDTDGTVHVERPLPGRWSRSAFVAIPRAQKERVEAARTVALALRNRIDRAPSSDTRCEES